MTRETHVLPAPPSPTRHAPAADVRRHGRLVMVAAWLVVAMATAAAGFAIWRDRVSTLESARTELSTMVRAYAEHVDKTVEGADQALRFLRSEYRRQGQALDITGYLKNEDIIQADFHLLSVIGSDGFLSHSSVAFKRVDLREREHFKVHAESSGDRLFISKPVLGKASGKWSIQFTRRIAAEQGAFGGVTVLSMPPEYFSRYFQSTRQGESMVTVLAGTDGFIRARSPIQDGALGFDLRERPFFHEAREQGEGSSVLPATADDEARVWAYRTLQHHGLVVLTGRTVDDVLAGWRVRSLGALLALLAATGCVLALATMLRRHMQAQGRLLEALKSGTAQLHHVVAAMVDGSSKVAAAGSTMSESAQHLAIRTDQQGDRLRSTSQGVRDVVSHVGEGAERMTGADARCTALREQTHGGRAVVMRSVQAIEGIAARSREMGEAVAMIESIAFQTNILALNAAVEAARAGDAGRAFAVVAGEVRELATRSRRSAGDVRSLIARANEQAAAGAAEASAVQQVLDGIAGGVDAVADEMRTVADQARQQSASLVAVMDGLDELTQITQSNADMVAQSVMAAEDMRDHAQRLRELVADIERDSPQGDLAPAVRVSVPRTAEPAVPAVAQPAVEYF